MNLHCWSRADLTTNQSIGQSPCGGRECPPACMLKQQTEKLWGCSCMVNAAHHWVCFVHSPKQGRDPQTLEKHLQRQAIASKVNVFCASLIGFKAKEGSCRTDDSSITCNADTSLFQDFLCLKDRAAVILRQTQTPRRPSCISCSLYAASRSVP
jgi:hypothetical protein